MNSFQIEVISNELESFPVLKIVTRVMTHDLLQLCKYVGKLVQKDGMVNEDVLLSYPQVVSRIPIGQEPP